MEEWVKKSDVLGMLSLSSGILEEHIYELKGIWIDKESPNDNWILCEEKLPQYTDEYNVTVGVASEFGYFEKVTTLRFERVKGKEPRWVVPKHETYCVIAWQPLPLKYEC